MLQRDPEWYALRLGKFTGSRFSDLMATTRTGPAVARKNLIVTLALERMTGQVAEEYQNAAMQRGIELEPEARAAYEMHVGDLVTEVPFIAHPKYEFVGVSPDGLVGSEGMTEFKCPSSLHKHVAALMAGEHAKEYKWQLQGQLWVAGRAWVDAVSYDPRFPDGLKLAVKRVERDEKAIEELEHSCIEAEEEVCELVAKLSDMQQAA